MRGLGQETDCPEGSAAGLVPGVCYPGRMPPTSPAHVEALLGNLPRPVRTAILRNTPSAITAAGARSLVEHWSNAAWNALQVVERAYQNAAVVRFPASVVLRTPVAPGSWLVSEVPVAQGGLQEFFRAWRQSIDNLRRSWDRLHAPKLALREHLIALDAEDRIAHERAALDQPAVLEVRRQAGIFALLTLQVQTLLGEQTRTIRPLLVAREQEFGLASIWRDLEEGLAMELRALGRLIGGILRFTIGNVAFPILQGLGWMLIPIAAVAAGWLLLSSGGARRAARGLRDRLPVGRTTELSAARARHLEGLRRRRRARR